MRLNFVITMISMGTSGAMHRYMTHHILFPRDGLAARTDQYQRFIVTIILLLLIIILMVFLLKLKTYPLYVFTVVVVTFMLLLPCLFFKCSCAWCNKHKRQQPRPRTVPKPLPQRRPQFRPLKTRSSSEPCLGKQAWQHRPICNKTIFTIPVPPQKFSVRQSTIAECPPSKYEIPMYGAKPAIPTAVQCTVVNLMNSHNNDKNG